jgi:molecular chaperone DnaK (HSP70)
LKIPRLQKIVADMFGSADIMTGLAPDEVIAIGAARQASYLPESWDSNFEEMTVTVQATSKGIYFKVRLDFLSSKHKSQSFIRNPMEIGRVCSLQHPQSHS